MPKTLDRPPSAEAPAPPVVEPSKAPPAPKRPASFVRWLGWLALVVFVAAAGVLLVVRAIDEPYVDADGSHAVAEEARMALLAPVAPAAAGSPVVGPEVPMDVLAPVIVLDAAAVPLVGDGAVVAQPNSTPVDDGSSLTAEEARMARLAP